MAGTWITPSFGSLLATSHHRGANVVALSSVIGDFVDLRRRAYAAYRAGLGPDAANMLIALRVRQAGCSASVSISPRAVHHALLAKMSVSSTVFVKLRAPEGQVGPTRLV